MKKRHRYHTYPDECTRCGRLMKSAVCACGANFNRRIPKKKNPSTLQLPTVAEALPQSIPKDRRVQRV